MEEFERPVEAGEVVTPAQTQAAASGPAAPEAETPAPERGAARPQSHEDNHRYQAARRGGERTGYERALRELRQQLDEHDAAARRQAEFVAGDAANFTARFPGVNLGTLDQNADFRRFCGSRYGRESIADLYEDYLALSGSAQRRAQALSESKKGRATASGGAGAGEALTASEQKALDEWNRAYPQMKMTAKEFLRR